MLRHQLPPTKTGRESRQSLSHNLFRSRPLDRHEKLTWQPKQQLVRCKVGIDKVNKPGKGLKNAHGISNSHSSGKKIQRQLTHNVSFRRREEKAWLRKLQTIPMKFTDDLRLKSGSFNNLMLTLSEPRIDLTNVDRVVCYHAVIFSIKGLFYVYVIFTN